MKKLFAITTIMLLAVGSYAQVAKMEGNNESLNKMMEAGYIEYTIPSDVTVEQVEKSAQYYTEYFSVQFDENASKVKFNFVNPNDNFAKMVVNRFLSSIEVSKIE